MRTQGIYALMTAGLMFIAVGLGGCASRQMVVQAGPLSGADGGSRSYALNSPRMEMFAASSSRGKAYYNRNNRQPTVEVQRPQNGERVYSRDTYYTYGNRTYHRGYLSIERQSR
ncbi:hypothetical protein [Poriferisphaera corsica]|nr:hypothetical protein [Poriferisphaera corsica]